MAPDPVPAADTVCPNDGTNWTCDHVRPAESVCRCGPWCEPFWGSDEDGWECRFCGADWGADTGFDGPWHHEWCVHELADEVRTDA